MEQFVINGPTHLKGEVKISGAKNSALPIIAASLLVDGEVTLSNVPHIKDVEAIIDLLNNLGLTTKFNNNVLKISGQENLGQDLNPDLVKHLRASILLISPLLVRNQEVSIPHPGGCLIGARPIDVHVNALKKMGATYNEGNNEYTLKTSGLNGTEVSADFSVTGTENIVMAAALTPGITKINLAAAEPHVQDLCHFLIKAGANITGLGTHNLTIEGAEALHKVSHEIIPDQIEAGTFAIAAAATKGQVIINGFVKNHHESLLSKFDKAGVRYKLTADKNLIEILPSHQLNPFNIRTEIYPGFPTDLQAPMAVLATQASGTSEIYETIFEGRLGYINELSKMGASCVVRDAHQATITGPSPLHGTRITSFDLRAGATLIIAAICAQGESRLDQIEVIDRGYENIESKFKMLGASIKRISLEEVNL